MSIFKHQHWHILILIFLLFCIYFIIQSDANILDGEFYGISTSSWFVFALLSAILHQIYVVICWRTELYNKSISNLFGTSGFILFKIGFAILILSRPITIILLAFSNANTFHINKSLSYLIAVIVLIPSIYLFYSVKKYFGMDRAFGIDHFYPEKHKDDAMIKKGIFKYTSNGMYVYGFLILWVPGILLQSKAALLVALFHHIYIWVHYYFTELPDMKFIYGSE